MDPTSGNCTIYIFRITLLYYLSFFTKHLFLSCKSRRIRRTWLLSSWTSSLFWFLPCCPLCSPASMRTRRGDLGSTASTASTPDTSTSVGGLMSSASTRWNYLWSLKNWNCRAYSNRQSGLNWALVNLKWAVCECHFFKFQNGFCPKWFFFQTGTLTEDSLDISGVVPIDDGRYDTPLNILIKKPIVLLLTTLPSWDMDKPWQCKKKN